MHKSGIVVCGCGHWGRHIARTMASLCALYGVVDTDEATARRVAAAHGVRVLSFEQALLDPGVVALMIATPAPTHAALAARALAAGKHVFVEKPMALDIAQAQMLATLAERQGLVLMVGHLLQFHPAFLALRALVDRGKIGTPWFIHSNRLSHGRLRQDEDVLWSFAPHDLSMILSLAGREPEAVKAHATRILSAARADIVHVELSFGALQAAIMVSWLHPVKEHRLTVMGDKGALVFDDGQDWERKLQFYGHSVEAGDPGAVMVKGAAEAVALVPAEPLLEECRHFVACVTHGQAPRTGAQEALAVIRVLSHISRAMGSSAAAPYFVHETAVVDEDVTIGEGSRLWHFTHILSGSRIGRNVVVGQNVCIGPDVTVGDGCRIQNNVSLYAGVTLAEDVFCGPACVFTNVRTPRAHVSRREAFLPTPVGRGASIGANATILCGNPIGAYAMIGAGAVVTKAVKAHALVVGNPARQTGWVSHSGEVLPASLICPREKRRYRVNAQGELEPVPEAPAHG